jgi:tetratricopeptide (TPR) repeat protein
MKSRALAWLMSTCLAVVACDREAKPPRPHTIHSIEDDYARALAEAQKRKLPLFVDVWASWCHTCMSMKQYVLPRPELMQLADSFVWLSIDSERAQNRAFLQRFPSRFLPTLWVIDAARQAPLLKWNGVATPDELSLVLRQAAGDAAHPAKTDADNSDPTALWLRGDRASAAGDGDGAIALYQRALAAAPGAWPLRARTAQTLSMRLMEGERHDQVFALALREGPRLEDGTARLNVVLNGIDAGVHSDASHQDPAAWKQLVELGARIATQPERPILLDDRSSLLLSLVTALHDTEPARAQQLAAAWSKLLEAEAARAPTPAARRVWDAHRLEAFMALGQTDKAVPMLEQSEREDPGDYNAPARLARAYLALGKLPDARAAIDRALPLCEGPRKLRLYMLAADIRVAASDRHGARDALRQALDFARDQRLGPQYDKLRRTIERRVRELS